MAVRESTPSQVAFRDRMVEAGVLVPMGVDGLLGKGRSFMQVFTGLDDVLLSRRVEGEDHEYYRFPPLIPRPVLEKTDYPRSFPDLIGTIHSFSGGNAEHSELVRLLDEGEDWSVALEATDVTLLPASCYPLYPMAASSQLPEGGRSFDVLGTCFRNEPSADPARQQIFHQREFVRVGSPDDAVAFRDLWLERSMTILGDDLLLKVHSEVANDPFFGRAGRMLAANQRGAALKFEVLATVGDADHPTAITSCNCHGDHLGAAFEIDQADGSVAHSACVGFGMERIVLALFSAHGTDLADWPSSVRSRLWP